MNRKGSALLIVLGVLSFLVVSAVAFSAFMRRSRLPSSYLRRTVAARQLAKAAAVRAIDEIDRAIANGVHPGIGGNSENTWKDRVFYRGGTEQEMKQTVPVLTMESLTYIPPPLINEARYHARKTPTSVWQAFGYDVGRYAYLAIDVSDYFDVNRLVANYPRSSSANRRLTVSHLFEDVNHTSAPSGADGWDEFMDTFRTIDDDTLEINFDSSSKIPLVSLADFNLALAANGSIGPLKSPFTDYLIQGSFYTVNSGAALEKYGEMTFVTDGWFPRAASQDKYDLGDGRYQPFPMDRMTKDNPLLLSQAVAFYNDQIAPSTEAETWYTRLSGLGIAALADYLDVDRVPISLGVPTTERVPMICAVQPKFSQDPVFSVERATSALSGKDGAALATSDDIRQREVEQTVRWNIKVDDFVGAFVGGKVRTVIAYPFLHPDEKDSKSWKLEGKFSMFFTSGAEIPFRTRNESDALHIGETLPDSKVDPDTGVINVKLENGSPSFNQIKTEQAAVSDSVELRLDGAADAILNLANEGNEILRVTYQWTQTRSAAAAGIATSNTGEWTPTFEQVFDDPKKYNATLKAHTVLPPLSASSNGIGSRDADFTDDSLSTKLTENPAWSKAVYLNAAVWLRIKDDDGKVVDMVPASIMDDATQNKVTDPMLGLLTSQGRNMTVDGEAYPVLKFSTGITFDFGIEGMKSLEGATDKKVKISPAAVMVPDPRFNHAPENWFAYNNGDVSAGSWLEKNLSSDGDGDIFMATSDSGYLQSIYELAFLPRFTNLKTYGASKGAGDYNVPQNDWNGNEYKESAADTLNGDLAWYTYSPYEDDRSAFNELPFTSEGTGMKVNPCSDSTNVLLAAFANTPVDWRRASTNDMEGTTDYARMEVDDFNSKYAWNEYNGTARMAWSDLRAIAGRLKDEVRSNGGNWTNAWDKLGWEISDDHEFLKHQLENRTDEIWSVDRKFFYGFWRDCFAAKQQLFLVFIRAEPLMLGGGTADEMPPQLGARAVALVWRDPASSTQSENGYPHRTRLLFYRPLE